MFDTSGPEAAAFARRRAPGGGGARGAVPAAGHGPDRACAPTSRILPALTVLLRVARAEAAALKRCGIETAVDAARARRPGRSSARWASRGRAARPTPASPRRPIPTRRRWRRTPTATEAHVGDPIHLDVMAIGKARCRSTSRRRWSWGRSRCSTARRASRTWATGGCKRQFTLTIAAYEPGAEEDAGDRGDLPRPARRRAHGADAAAADEDRQPHRQRARAGAQGRGAAGDGDGGEPAGRPTSRAACWRRGWARS